MSDKEFEMRKMVEQNQSPLEKMNSLKKLSEE